MVCPSRPLIHLAEIAAEVEDTESDELEPAEYAAGNLIIIERVDGYARVVDGFHRASGLLSWAMQHGVTQRLVIRVIDVTGYDDVTVSDAAEPGPRQKAALARIRLACL